MQLLIIGAGGHGKVICETALSIKRWHKVAFVDDNYPHVTTLLDYPIIEKIKNLHTLPLAGADCVIAIGNNNRRIELLMQLQNLGGNLPIIMHPTSWVSPLATIGIGTVILPKAVINIHAKIGSGCIINSGAIVEHDCILGDGVHLASNVCLGGGVSIGARTWLGVGSSVLGNVKIGADKNIPAGSIITKNML